MSRRKTIALVACALAIAVVSLSVSRTTVWKTSANVPAAGERVTTLAAPSEPFPAAQPLAPDTSRKPLSIRLAGNEPDRWLQQWADGLSRLSSGELWALANDPALSHQVEAKALRESLARGCLVSLSEREFARQKPGLVDDWCQVFQAMGGTQFLRDQSSQLVNDADLLSSPSHILGTRTLRGTQAERDEELAMLESAFRMAADPWALRASVRSLWRYNSPTLSADWSQITALSRFQQGRLGEFVAAEVTCRSTGDCDAASPWLVELCAFTPGLVCPSHSNVDALISQNLSAAEASILRHTVARALAMKAGARPRG